MAGKGPAPAGGPRVVAVLGYSARHAHGLHPICAERLERAASLTTPQDIVVLSGSGRAGSGRSEADLMLQAWDGPAATVICDPLARTTAENARAVTAIVAEHDSRDVLVVTSRWHAPRARFLFRATLGPRAHVEVAAAGSGLPLLPVLREAVSWPLVPVQFVLAGSRGRG